MKSVPGGGIKRAVLKPVAHPTGGVFWNFAGADVDICRPRMRPDNSIHLTRTSLSLRWLTSTTHSARTGLRKENHHARDDTVSVSQHIYSGKTETYSFAAATLMIHGFCGSGNWSFLARQPPPTPKNWSPKHIQTGAPRFERPHRVFERPRSGPWHYSQVLFTDTAEVPGLQRTGNQPDRSRRPR